MRVMVVFNPFEKEKDDMEKEKAIESCETFEGRLNTISGKIVFAIVLKRNMQLMGKENSRKMKDFDDDDGSFCEEPGGGKSGGSSSSKPGRTTVSSWHVHACGTGTIVRMDVQSSRRTYSYPPWAMSMWHRYKLRIDVQPSQHSNSLLIPLRACMCEHQPHHMYSQPWLSMSSSMRMSFF